MDRQKIIDQLIDLIRVIFAKDAELKMKPDIGKDTHKGVLHRTPFSSSFFNKKLEMTYFFLIVTYFFNEAILVTEPSKIDNFIKNPYFSGVT